MKFSTGFYIALVCGFLLFIFKAYVGQVFLPLVIAAAVLPGLIARRYALLYSLCVATIYILCEVVSIILQTTMIDSRRIFYPSYLHVIFIVAVFSGFVLDKIQWLGKKTKSYLGTKH